MTHRALVVGLLVLLAVGVPTAASAQEDGDDLEFGPKPADTPSVFPIEEFSGGVQDIVFPVASVDGAVVDGGNNTFELSADVLFAFDKADLTPRARDELAAIAEKVRPAVAGGRSLTVVGHTDSVGADDYNQRLSTDRAESVRGALATALGPATTITATGRGESEPIADNDTTDGQARNRRVEIAVR